MFACLHVGMQEQITAETRIIYPFMYTVVVGPCVYLLLALEEEEIPTVCLGVGLRHLTTTTT